MISTLFLKPFEIEKHLREGLHDGLVHRSVAAHRGHVEVGLTSLQHLQGLGLVADGLCRLFAATY